MSRHLDRTKEAGLAYLLIAPALVLAVVFIIYPFMRNFSLFLYHAPPYPGLPSHFAGLSQFTTMLTSSTFLQGLGATLLYTVIVVPTGVLLGLILAVVAHQKLPHARFLRRRRAAKRRSRAGSRTFALGGSRLVYVAA